MQSSLFLLIIPIVIISVFFDLITLLFLICLILMSYLNFASYGLYGKKSATGFRDFKLLEGSDDIMWREVYYKNEIEYNKHGISQKHIPRSGGMLIIFFLIIHLSIR